MFKLLSLVILSAAVISISSILPKTRVNSSPKAASTSPMALKITRSLVGTGETYGIWVTTDNSYDKLYTGKLEISLRYCDDCAEGSSGCQYSCQANQWGYPAPSIWRTFNDSDSRFKTGDCSPSSSTCYLYVNGGYSEAKIPAGFPSRVTFFKIKPYPNPENKDWSNEVQLNVRTTQWLENTKDYWIFWNTPKKFVGRNFLYGENFTTMVGYEPASNICGAGTGRAMTFTKNNVYGYWGPAVPWYNQVWSGTPNWEKNLNKFNFRFKRDIKFYIMNWAKKFQWTETFLYSYASVLFDSFTSPLLTNRATSYLYYPNNGTTFPNYALLPEWIGSGWSNGMNQAGQYSNFGSTDVLCQNNTKQDFSNIWSVRANFVPLKRPDGSIVSALLTTYWEGASGFHNGADFLREDWWFVDDVGLVRIDVKQFGTDSTPLGRLPCKSDPDCLANVVMVRPHVSLSREDYALPITQSDFNIVNSSPTPALSSCKSTLDGNTGAYLEAEKYSAVSGSFAKVSDSTRSNGAYMHIPKGKGSSFDGKSTTYLTYNLNVVNGGTFNIFLLGYGLDSASDSFYVSLDGGTPVSRPLTLASWGWVKLSTTFSLPTGSHTLKIIKREDGSRLDKIYLSKSSTYPSGLGGSAVSCN